MVERLLKLLLTKTNRHFKGLCECLIETEQEYIVEHCLSKEGKAIINTREVFFKKNIVAVSFLQNISFPLNEIIQA